MEYQCDKNFGKIHLKITPMQTLRSRRSPSKYKNEPTRFLGDGMTFKAKLIGILEVSEARGDKMCQDALNDLKTAIRAAGEHKQRITISIAIDGLRLRDEKTGDSMYHHPVHKISFIAQDMSDSRAFGYIFGSPDTGHRFFGIKTDKTASQVVIAMRDLFQVVFELKKKEIEMTKMHIELRQRHFGGDSGNKEETDKIKPKAETERLKTSSSSREGATASSSSSSAKPQSSAAATAGNSTAIADLLDLEDELNSIQQGISQMDRITPSDPFGPLTLKGDSFLESFKERTSEASKTSVLKLYSSTSKELPDCENSTNVFGSAASTNSRAVFFPPQTSPVPKKDQHWFDQETESLFSDAVNVPADTSTSPVTFHTPTGGEPEQSILDERKSPPGKADLFRDLDPLGTGKTKPYLDKKDFFQELKNPPKKVLKELISDPSVKSEPPTVPPDIESLHVFSRTVSSSNLESVIVSTSVASVTTSFLDSFNKDSRYAKIDPFEDMDPFDKADPFLEDSFPKSIGFPNRNLCDGLQDRAGFRTERQSTRTPEDKWMGSPSKSNVFSSSIHGPLRVSLPPEKPDSNTTISLASLTSRFRSSPSPTEDSKVLKRKHYQTLKHSFEDKSDEHGDSPILEEVYVRTSPKPSSKSFDKKILIGSPPPVRSDKIKAKMSSSLELLDATPDPPPRPKTTLFAIKPPPLPPKKQNQPNFRPPARPPSLEENFHYDYLRQKSENAQKDVPIEPHVSPKKTGSAAMKRQNSFDSVTNFPILPKPPQRKSSMGSDRSDSVTTPTSVKTPSEKEPSVLNITLNQLDQSGMASLAASLGIPTENVCNMTLQELTKMLASKYLGNSEAKVQKQEESNFQADFDSNFSNISNSEDGFDKYAVFKELFDIDSSKTVDVDRKTETSVSFEENNVFETDIIPVQPSEDGEDKYAALRQLSLSAQKSENLSDELDASNEDDSSCRADNVSDIIKQTDESPTPLNNQDTEPASEPSFRKEPLDEITEKFSDEGEICDPDWVSEKKAVVEETVVSEVTPEIIPPVELEKTEDYNWATFQKDEEPPVPVPAPVPEKKLLPNEPVDISPISSDGKDDCHPESFDWGKNSGPNFPWRDEDESWDDQSAKESYWSDESSHDGQSPLKENMPYQRKTWNKHVKPTKGPPEPGRSWHRRWVDDTEDEYEEVWRRRRGPAAERDRKRDMAYDGRWVREREWEADRRGRGGRRKGSSEFRRHCDSESDKEPRDADENYDIPAGSKQKQYYGSNRDVAERHWADTSRESRSKYKKPSSHKRPSSASEAWRYDRYSNMDYPPRVSDKRESEDDDYLPRFRPSRKDLRYHSNIEHYGSYDRRVQATNQRRVQRGKRLKNAPADDPRWSESRYCLAPETPRSAQSEDTPEATKELHFKFEDDFTPSPSSHEPPSLKKALTERTVRDDWGRRVPRKSSSPATDNNNESFASFDDDFQVSPALPKDKAKDEGVFRKPSLKGRPKVGRQDSSTCLRKSESINIFSRESDPFEDDDFFSSGNNGGDVRGRFFAEKSRSNTNVSDPFGWKDMFGNSKFED